MSVFPIAAGHPDWSAGKSIPELFSAKMLIEFYESCFIPQITNSDYEGEIKEKGDKVNIPILPDIDVIDYEANDTIDYPLLSPGNIALTVDKAKLWRYRVDKVMNHQSLVDWLAATVPHATERAKRTVERAFLADIYASAHADNLGLTAGKISSSYNLGVTGTPLQFTAANSVEVITRLDAVLDEQDAPQEGRYAVISTWMGQKLKNSELREANKTGDPKSTMRTGLIGKIGKIDIYESNLLKLVVDGADTCTNAIFGQKSAVCFASQFTDTRMGFELENTIGKASRGLQVYGYKAIKSEALGHLYVKP